MYESDKVRLARKAIGSASVCARMIHANCQIGRVSGHAEIIALERASQRIGSWRLDRQAPTLYVSIKPCAMCLAAAAQSRIARIVFAGSNYMTDPVVKEILQLEHAELQAASVGLLQSFFRERR